VPAPPTPARATALSSVTGRARSVRLARSGDTYTPDLPLPALEALVLAF